MSTKKRFMFYHENTLYITMCVYVYAHLLCAASAKKILKKNRLTYYDVYPAFIGLSNVLECILKRAWQILNVRIALSFSRVGKRTWSKHAEGRVQSPVKPNKSKRGIALRYVICETIFRRKNKNQQNMPAYIYKRVFITVRVTCHERRSHTRNSKA